MRRPVMVGMSAVTVVVAVASLRSSERGYGASSLSAAGPAGVVQPAPTAPATAPPTVRARAVAPHAAKKPAAVATHAAAAPSPVRAKTPAPVAVAPRRTTAAKPKPSPTTATTTTVNGAPADTQYGPVQVQITIRGHRIIKADAIEYPQGSSQDQQINSQAIPQLDQETLDAQSSNIDTVSGATYTSDGYRQSLQSALDAAHRAGVW